MDQSHMHALHSMGYTAHKISRLSGPSLALEPAALARPVAYAWYIIGTQPRLAVRRSRHHALMHAVAVRPFVDIVIQYPRQAPYTGRAVARAGDAGRVRQRNILCGTAMHAALADTRTPLASHNITAMCMRRARWRFT